MDIEIHRKGREGREGRKGVSSGIPSEEKEPYRCEDWQDKKCRTGKEE
jgi:superfamily II DNA/RNA helicase